MSNDRGGWILAEVLLSILILGILVGGTALSQETARKFNAVQHSRLRCIAAAQAQLDSLSAQGRPVAPDEFRRLWPDVRMELALADGQGQWQGMKLVTATAIGKANGRKVKVELSRYYGRAVEVTP